MNIHGKTVRVVESHEEVLGDWADAARELGRSLTLVTLDRHTDTSPALSVDYTDYHAVEGGASDDSSSEPEFTRWQKRVLARFRDAEPEVLDALVERIQNDEHIDAALRLGIVDRALIVSSQAGRTGDALIPGASVYRPVCAPSCEQASHEDAACPRRRFDAILEATLLRDALAQLAFNVHDASPYILDIDLDTFSTRRGLTPADATIFHALIRGAHLITLAREPEYVNESMDDHDADEIEAAVLRHVATAMHGVRVGHARGTDR